MTADVIRKGTLSMVLSAFNEPEKKPDQMETPDASNSEKKSDVEEPAKLGKTAVVNISVAYKSVFFKPNIVRTYRRFTAIWAHIDVELITRCFSMLMVPVCVHSTAYPLPCISLVNTFKTMSVNHGLWYCFQRFQCSRTLI